MLSYAEEIGDAALHWVWVTEVVRSQPQFGGSEILNNKAENISSIVDHFVELQTGEPWQLNDRQGHFMCIYSNGCYLISSSQNISIGVRVGRG